MTSALTAPQPIASKLPVHLRTRSTITEPAIDASADRPKKSPFPTDQEGIDELRVEIDDIDAKLVELILRRTAISHAIGRPARAWADPRSSTAGRWPSWNASARWVPPAPTWA